MPELPEEDLKDDDGGLDIFNPLKNLEVSKSTTFALKLGLLLYFRCIFHLDSEIGNYT